MARSSSIIYLPIAAAIAALVMPPMSGSVSQTVQTLFIPIAWPSHKTGLMLRERFMPQKVVDPLNPNSSRTIAQYREMNAQLLNQISSMQQQIDAQDKLLAQFQQMKFDLRSIVKPATVVGTSPDHRETLLVTAVDTKKLYVGAAVVTPLGMVGRIDAIGLTGGNARVLLLTDPASHVTGRFVRYGFSNEGKFLTQELEIDPPLIEGNGTGLIAKMLKTKVIRENLRIGDSVLLDDSQQFPQPALKGQRIGMVTNIRYPSSDAFLTDVEITPITNYKLLPEVMVVTK